LGLIKRGWIWVLAIFMVAGVFAAFRLGKKTDPDYFTAKVEKGDIRQVIEATGTINPVTSVQVGSQVSGMISKLYVDFNSRVTKGQVIAEIDPKLFEGAVLQAQADLQNSQALLAAAKANVAKDQATQQQNKLDYDRAVGLQRQGVNSQQQLDQAKATYDAITAQVGSDRAAIQQAEAQVAQKTATLKVAQTNLDYTIIRAPINGTVVARNIDIGQTVAASLQAPTLFMIALDLTKMQVYAKTDEGDVGQIRPGQKADFQVDAFPKEMFHGVVFQVRCAKPLFVGFHFSSRTLDHYRRRAYERSKVRRETDDSRIFERIRHAVVGTFFQGSDPPSRRGKVNGQLCPRISFTRTALTVS